jgi:hypothetical protein
VKEVQHVSHDEQTVLHSVSKQLGRVSHFNLISTECTKTFSIGLKFCLNEDVKKMLKTRCWIQEIFSPGEKPKNKDSFG